jgi:hypothetical protein
MSVGTQTSPLNMIAGEALEAHRLVRLSGSTINTVVYADAGERAIGVTLVQAASGAMVAVEMLAAGQTLKVTSAGVITANSAVYTANDGKISDSVSGIPIGTIRGTGATGVAAEMIPYGMTGGGLDTDMVEFYDDFLYPNTDESGSEGQWLLDANNGGVLTMQDAHAGVVVLTASDTTDADNDESYLITPNEIYKPTVGTFNGQIVARLYARLKLTEANTDDANILFGLLGGDTIDVENTIADNGGLTAANTYIAIHKDDGGTVWEGGVHDSAADEDTNIGAFTTNTWTKVEMVISDADITDGQLDVNFLIDGVSGGTKQFALASAGEMRLILGVKNGGASVQAGGEALHIDKVYFTFARS